MSSPEPVSVSTEMQISEWSGLDHILTPGVDPTYTMWTVRWDQYPKKNHGDLSRTRKNGGWAKTATAHCGRRVFEAHPALVPLLCALWCVAISLRCISESVVSTVKSGSQVYPTSLLDTPLSSHTKGPVCYLLCDHTVVLTP